MCGRGLRHFHVVVVQKRQRIAQRSVVHVQVVVLLIKPIVLFFVDLLVAITSLDLRPRPNVKLFMRRTKL